LDISQIIANKLKAFTDLQFVKECASVLKAAEILRPEITSFLKLSEFFTATVDRGMIWQEIHSVILKKLEKVWWHVRLRLMGVQK